MSNKLTLHPNSYLKLKTPIKFYIQDSINDEQFEIIKETLLNQSTPLVMTGQHKKGPNNDGWKYYLNTPAFSLKIKEFIKTDKKNFSCEYFNNDKKGRAKYNNPYFPIFLVEAAAGIHLIREKKTYIIEPCDYGKPARPCVVLDGDDWSMDSEEFNKLVFMMNSYFLGEDSYNRSQHISRRMESRIITPFKNFSEKEHNLELQSIDLSRGLFFNSREFKYRNSKSVVYTFYSNDEKANPENLTLSVGNRISICTKNNDDLCFTGKIGILLEIDDVSSDSGVIFVIEFMSQFDDDQLPQQGYLCQYQNDTQYKIRNSVYRSIMNGSVPATFMYRTFNDFSVDGYEIPKEDLAEFLKERLAERYPPNQMQFETIVKGILTKDTLLVLGPPGTGKTTVILAWIKYFIKHNIRVLISSQNNAAVDNVLERFKDEEDAVVLRLGREEKVQDNCKELLPQYKIEEMHKECEIRRKEVKETLAYDLEQIDKYISELREYIKAVENFLMKREVLRDQCTKIGETAKHIKNIYDINNKNKKIMEDLRRTIVRKEIFLQESGKKNFLRRLMLRRYIKKVKKDIAPTREKLIKCEEACKKCVTSYAEHIRIFQRHLQTIRGSAAYKEYFDSRSQVEKLHISYFKTDGSNTCAITPVFKSVLATMYKPFKYTANFKNNMAIFQLEITRMERLKKSAEKIEFASNEWAKSALGDNRNDIFEELLIDSCNVVGATCIGINSNKKFANVDFGVTIIDESGQIQIHNALVPMSRSQKTLMLGDYKQIPPIASPEIVESCEKDGISTELYTQSFFEFLFQEMRKREIGRLINSINGENKTGNASSYIEVVPSLNPKQQTDEDSDPDDVVYTEEDARRKLLEPTLPYYSALPKKDGEPLESPYSSEEITNMIYSVIQDGKKIVNLNSQFRMPGSISDIISEWFYESNYYSGYDMSRFAAVVPATSKPIVLINTAKNKSRQESQPESKMGYQNLYEAKIVADVIQSVLMNMDEENRQKYINSVDSQLGVISAYGAQVRAIRKALNNRKEIEFSHEQVQSAVASLDSFQGQERNLIIYSLTRSNSKTPPNRARIGFLKELRRLNVAFTRAKKQLVIIGDIDYLMECLYVKPDELSNEFQQLPCEHTADSIITPEIINQCADCPKECERRFSRFLKLLVEHVKGENGRNASGDYFYSDEFIEMLKGE